MTAFHGNFFVRQTDLLALPNVSRDHSYTIEVGIEENITTPTVCFQTALLHTTVLVCKFFYLLVILCLRLSLLIIS